MNAMCKCGQPALVTHCCQSRPPAPYRGTSVIAPCRIVVVPTSFWVSPPSRGDRGTETDR